MLPSSTSTGMQPAPACSLIGDSNETRIVRHAVPARNVRVGRGLRNRDGFCLDLRHAKQAERLASFLDYNVKSALGIVNVEADDPKACGSASVAYIRGGVLGTIRNKSETYQIVEVIVVGVGSDRGFRNVAPTTYVSLVKIDERMA